MAFGGIGAVAGLVTAANILPAGAYASQINGPALAAGPFWQKTGAGALQRNAGVERRSSLNSMRIGAVGAALLTDFVAGGGVADPSKADTGQFMTAAAAGQAQGLAANFGPGRANWIADDSARLLVILEAPDQNVDDSRPSFQIVKTIAAGDLLMTIRNTALAAGANNYIDGSAVLLVFLPDDFG